MAGDRGDETDEDGESLWAFVARTIRPLRRERRSLAEGPSQPPAKKSKKGEAAESYAPFIPPPAAPPPPALPAGAGLDRRSDKKLRRGQMEIDGRIDLHGFNREQAYEALGAFLQRGQARGWRCVLVITGKGRGGQPGVLRQAVPEWLAVPPLAQYVLRAHAAQPRHGGEGALYVLLRRIR